MAVFLIIVSCLLWLAALWTLRGRQIASPALSFAALLCLSQAETNGYHLLPLNMTILSGWLVMTVVVMFTTYLQPIVVRSQTRGWGYLTVGALAGMAVGLLGFTVTSSVSMLYAIMILGTVAGTYLGFLLYTRTPEGCPVAPGSGNFFRYLLAKGFPTVITVMQIGVALTLAIYVNQ